MSVRLVKNLFGTMLLCLVWTRIFGQEEPPLAKVTAYSVEEGLSDRSVNGFAQDKDGFLWIGTNNGLNRFDGYEFLVYNSRAGNPLRIRSSQVQTVLADRFGQLLVAYNEPAAGQIDRLDPRTGVLEALNFRPETGFQSGNRGFYQAPDGTIYINVAESGGVTLYRYDDVSAQLQTVFRTPFPALPSNAVTRLLKATDGTYWMAFANENTLDLHVVRFDDAGHILQSYGNVDFRLPRLTAEAIKIELNIGPNETTLFSVPTHSVYELPSMQSQAIKRFSGLPLGGYAFARDRKGNLLAYQHTPTNPANGSFLLTADGSWHNYSWIYRYLPSVDLVFSEDFAEGILVAGGEGFHTIRLEVQRFTTFLNRGFRTNSGRVSVRSMARLRNDKLYISTDTDGLFELDPRSSTCMRPGDKNPALTMLNTVKAPKNLLTEGDSVLWITDLGRLLRYDPGRGTIRVIPTTNKRNPNYEEEVWGLAWGPDNALWAIVANGSLLRLDRSTGTVSTYHDASGTSPLKGTNPCFIMADRMGVLWIGTTNTGLVRVDIRSGRATRYVAIPGDLSALQDNHITCIQEDSIGRLWIGTLNAGLHIFDPITGRVLFHYTKQNGLPHNSIAGVLPDRYGNVWVSTFSGLACLNGTSNGFRSYSKADGLAHNEFNRFAYLYDVVDGRFYFGGVNGLISFDEDINRQVWIDVPVLLSSISLPGHNGQVSEIYYVGNPDSTRITVTEGLCCVELNVALGTYFEANANHYAYRIEGLTSDWQYIGDSRKFRLPPLPPGVYRVEIRAANAEGKWSRRVLSIRLEVRRLWYKTGWAMLFYVALLALVIYGWVRKRARRPRVGIIRSDEWLSIGESAKQQKGSDRFASETAEISTPLHQSDPTPQVTTGINTAVERERTDKATPEENAFLTRVLEVAEAQLSDPDFGGEEMARAVFLSHSQLNRRLNEINGQSSIQLLRELRLRRAQQLLRNPEATVAEVAWASGFREASYFSRVFTRAFGMSPTEWRKKQADA